jgi:hypothetical protein
MKHHAVLVQTPDGRLVRKPVEEMQPEDALVFDGPDAFAGDDALQRWVEAQAEAAGGLDRWIERVQREGLSELPPSLKHLAR